jgi:hypothetical protein
MASDQIKRLEGRLRALEALIISLPGVTEASLETARHHIAEDVRRRDGQMAKLQEKLGKRLDENAQDALDEIVYALKSRRL